MIDQRLPMVSLPRLKQLGKSRMRRGQRLRGKHLPEQDRSPAQLVLLHQHAPVHRLRFTRAPRSALLVVVDEDRSVRHELPPAAHPHPFRPVHRSRLPRRSRTFMRRWQLQRSACLIGMFIPGMDESCCADVCSPACSCGATGSEACPIDWPTNIAHAASNTPTNKFLLKRFLVVPEYAGIRIRERAAHMLRHQCPEMYFSDSQRSHARWTAGRNEKP